MDLAVKGLVPYGLPASVEFHVVDAGTEGNLEAFRVLSKSPVIRRATSVQQVVRVAKKAKARHCPITPLMGQAGLDQSAGGAFGDLADTVLGSAVCLRDMRSACNGSPMQIINCCSNFTSTVRVDCGGSSIKA